MAHKSWVFDVCGSNHIVELDHGYWSGKRKVKVDGMPVEKSWKLIDTGTEHRFQVDGTNCVLRIRPGTLGGLFGFDHELFVDGWVV